MLRLQFATAILLALIASVSEAQNRVFTLRPAAATLEHEFTRVGSVRELSDGRILVTDTEDDLLFVADFQSGAMRPFSSKGAGPGEYRDLGTLIPLRGDTTIMADASNRRALVLFRDAVVRTLAVDDPMLTVVGTDIVGATANGRVFALRRLPPTDFSAPRSRNPVALLRWEAARTDTVARLRGIEMQTVASGAPPNQTMRTSTSIMSSPEQAVVFPTGDVAVALQDPYRVDWYLANGQVRRGQPIERTAPRIDDAEKVAWKRRYEEWAGRALPFSLEQFPWAEFVPPFRQGALTALPDGMLLLAREPWSGGPDGLHDIVDRSGARVGTMRLSPGSRVVGTGRGSVFVVSRTDDGIERLSRHPWP